MYFTSLSLSALLLACEVSVISGKRVLFEGAPTPVQAREGKVAELLRREAWDVLEPERRSAQVGGSPVARAAAASSSSESGALNFNTPEWNQQTIAACTTALAQVKQASNPAGMVACYNLPFLNNQTGVFSADLRLYQLTTMTGDFTGVQANQISLALSYADAAVSQTGTAAKVKRQSTTVQQIPGGNQNELQQFQFVGQVNKTLSLSKIKTTQQMSLLIPTIQLSAPSPADAKTTVTTNLTTADTVYFVNGVFKGQSAAGASATVPTAAAAAQSSAGAFVVPGISFGIFPVGFIVTGTWAIFFFAAVGYGTYGRMQFRAHYRARVQRSK